MSGPERKRPQFAPEQEERIDYYAFLFAELGEEAIDDLRKERFGLMKLRFIFLKAGPDEIVFRAAQALGQEIELVNEIIDRADRNMRKAGTDRASEIRKLLVRERLGYLYDQASGEEGK
jgi:RecJ-like exonuclease